MSGLSDFSQEQLWQLQLQHLQALLLRQQQQHFQLQQYFQALLQQQQQQHFQLQQQLQQQQQQLQQQQQQLQQQQQQLQQLQQQLQQQENSHEVQPLLGLPNPYIQVGFETSTECESLGMSGHDGAPFSSPPLVASDGSAHGTAQADDDANLVLNAAETYALALDQTYTAVLSMANAAEAISGPNMSKAAEKLNKAAEAFDLAADYADERVRKLPRHLEARVQKLEEHVKALQEEDHEGSIFENAQNIEDVATINDIHFKGCLLHQKQNQEQFASLREEVLSLKKRRRSKT